MSISQTITDFVTLAIQAGGWMELDRLYLQNRVLAMIGEESLESISPTVVKKTSLELLDELVAQAVANGTVKEEAMDLEIFEAQLMDFLTPPPSVVNALFAQHYEKDPADATDYFFKLSQENDYIKTRAIAKNIVFPAETEYGQLEITINLSRPEKDPKQIAAERQAAQVDYPKCVLCMENEGYKGRTNYPARTNHRIIRMNLDGESWGFQYSPYAYYNEHSIILSEEHCPMVISKETFRRLIRIVEVLPHYFVGSNADLPIVGGSILTHDHYQAGRHVFPMEKAEIEQYFELSDFPLMNAGIVKWPMSVIRLQSPNSEDLVEAASLILEKWRNYSDEDVSIRAFSEDGTPHHTITPIARRKGQLFELDLVLRDNNVSTEYPDGIFHPHKAVQHIKKENIGLIEVMGLAVLPPRLGSELEEVEKYVLEKENQIADYHKKWADQMKEIYSFNKKNAKELIQKEVGQIFAQVLADAGVYKRTPEGQAAFKRFIDSL
ncbi:galactose-1-phosphate uridylyltransferase [Enterococcus haemoperoxidus ATCC BAA-382]|uniref:Galactose-1-phosphate uridylyltransferase n=1 Tax=Enterococcus haemoperoxidus ATCC BAA-382 TaxID=1158608 RepID=R2T4V7_9ENTE|nr:UDP-glucose--hexose-1-phosphate uridylyltransferase [Enterococcus haemoperoxidus]EOI00034.1 galactose-1-phosphate uridylyltransferase [Enterococcus haemoperoxidus ATCC BAA-382]EOT63112.1 galactose-1-phosphate uridylyltransferase [Enterococcus haemoperoxidus ATCC BAA-382]OJG53556.1 galactose-1-phosphate uridylyltransferase [Enterococcus haemoperoxidus]